MHIHPIDDPARPACAVLEAHERPEQFRAAVRVLWIYPDTSVDPRTDAGTLLVQWDPTGTTHVYRRRRGLVVIGALWREVRRAPRLNGIDAVLRDLITPRRAG